MSRVIVLGNPGGRVRRKKASRAITKRRRKNMARTRSGRFAKRRRKSTKHNGLTRRQRAARKGARTRRAKKVARSRAARKAARRRSSRGTVRRSPRRSRRASPRRARRASRRTRSRSRRKPGGHFRSYRSLSRRYGPRKASRIWRKRRKYVRSNPFTGWLPSMRDAKDIVKTGVEAYIGFVGVNAGLYGLDKIGLATLKAKIGNELGVAAVNAVARVLLTGIVAKIGSKVGLNGKSLALGGAFNVIYHGVQDVMASQPTLVPDSMKPLMLGYDGYGDWVQPGMNDWVQVPGMGLLPEPMDPGTTLA